MINYTKNYNEDLFHIFGYIKDEERIPNNNTPFLDFEGQADPESVKKINYFRKLNEKAMQARMKIKHGDLAKDQDKITVGPGIEGGRSLISLLHVMDRLELLDQINFQY